MEINGATNKCTQFTNEKMFCWYNQCGPLNSQHSIFSDTNHLQSMLGRGRYNKHLGIDLG